MMSRFLVAVCALAMVSARATTVTNLTAGMTLQDKVVYKVMSSTSLQGTSWGLSVSPNATSVLYIATGVTLTLRGANGSNAIGGYAGLRIPSTSTLVLVGEGGLSAYGGNAGNGGNGTNGGDYWRDYDDYESGAGGNGGAGGGGAAAGIGGCGGKGGTQGTSGPLKKGSWKDAMAGDAGGNGGNGTAGETMGELYALSSITVVGTAGSAVANPGLGGGQGEDENDKWQAGVSVWYSIGGGGGGGGGGVTDTEPSDIGGGSGGGGGGGGGGSGATDYRYSWNDDLQGGTGQGGRGGGLDGVNGVPEAAKDTGSNRFGGAGGAAGKAGAKGGDGKLFVSDLAVTTGGNISGFATTHEVLARKVTFDFDGGTCDGSSSVVRSTYLFLEMPDPPYPSRPGYLFAGFYTARNKGGTRYYDDVGVPMKKFWDIDEGCTLYAGWNPVDNPSGVNPLVVTRLEDEPFDQRRTYITLRAAVTFASVFGNLVNPDGTMNKITFDESLWRGKSSITLPVTEGVITIPENRFASGTPLVIEGPGHATCDVVVDGKKRDALFNVANGNHVVLRDLSLSRGASASTGGAVSMKSGSLRAENCVFAENSAVGSGGAVYAGETEDVWLENCRFEGNESSSRNQGGGGVYAGGRLTCVNLSFWGNKGTFGGAVYAAKTNVVVNSSFFKNVSWQTGGGIYAGTPNNDLTVVNCTMEANIANDQKNQDEAYDGGGGVYVVGGAGTRVNLVNSLFVGNRESSLAAPDVQFASKPATLNVYSSIFGKATPDIVENAGMNVRLGKREDAFFERNNYGFNYAKTVKNGVAHDYLMTVDTSGDVGYSVFHDATWRNVALAAGRTAGRAALVGNVSAATIFLGEDISARDLSPYWTRSQSGSYWFLHDHPENGLVVTLADDVSDYYDGSLSLREIIDGIASGEPIWTSNRVDGVYHVTFSPKLTNATIRMKAAQFDVRGPTNTNGVDIVVDGGANNIHIDGFCGDYYDPKHKEEPICFRSFRVRRGSALTVKNLSFTNCVGTKEGFVPQPRLDGGAILNLGRLTVSNCTFDCCAGGTLYDCPVGFGGAICNGDDSTNRAVMTVNDSVFRACRAARGGAIYNYHGCTATVNRCRFDSNRIRTNNSSFVAAGGAVFNAKDAVFVYSDTAFSDNTIEIDGFTIPSDIQKVNDEIHTIKYADRTMAVSLNALALPQDEHASWNFNAVFQNGNPAVSAQPTGLRPGLWYGLGYTFTLGTPFRVQDGTWVQADATGTLPSPLLAPRGDSRGFYRIFVREMAP